jgi:outer membrane protein assembly factor BamB
MISDKRAPHSPAHPFARLRQCRLLCLLALGCLAASTLPARADWPEFRGPWGNGYASAPGDTRPLGLPLHWSETNNVKWKIEIPHVGWSTPVVMDGQVWLTTAPMDGHDFFAICLDAETGAIRFNEKVFHCDNPESLGDAISMNCYATPSPVIEPGRVYVHFGSYGTACLDSRTAKVLWQRTDLPCRHFRGPSSSPIIFENLLILTMDGVDLQYTVALDKLTGKTVWKTDRTAPWNDETSPGHPAREGDLRKSHSTPFVATAAGKPLMLSAGAKAAYGYDPRTGAELWKVHYNDYSTAPRPLFDGTRAFFVTGGTLRELWAVNVGGQGDVTDTHLAWKSKAHVGRYASPLLIDGLLYLAADESYLTCFEPATGQVVWSERVPGRAAASPVYADGRIYLFNQQGATTVVKPGRSFEILATNTLADGLMASPAISGKAFIVRTRTHLYRVELLPSGEGATASRKDS